MTMRMRRYIIYIVVYFFSNPTKYLSYASKILHRTYIFPATLILIPCLHSKYVPYCEWNINTYIILCYRMDSPSAPKHQMTSFHHPEMKFVRLHFQQILLNRYMMTCKKITVQYIHLFLHAYIHNVSSFSKKSIAASPFLNIFKSYTHL